MSRIRDEIYLGALMHDIGKFYQRADKDFYESEELREQSKRIADLICPLTQDRHFSHQHVIWTNEFFEKHKALFQKFTSSWEHDDNVANLASYHHRPGTIFQAMIQLADWWASGLDRSQIGEYEQNELKTSRERYKEIPLSNILCALKIKRNDDDIEGVNFPFQKSFRLKPLNLDRNTVLPVQYSLNSRQDYEILWKKFEEKLKPDNFQTDSIRDFNITLFYILKQFTWCIPSFTQIDFPCISLFEHLKITSAIAQCFYDYYTEDSSRFIFDTKKHRLTIQDDAYPLQLVCFDLSNIQNFLYNISTKYAVKSLRGRSFYLQMLTESLYWYLIREIPDGFTPSHVVYASGGKFYMILPNTMKVNQLLNDLQLRIQEELWTRHSGELYLNIGRRAFRYDNKIESGKPNIRIEGDSENVFLGELWKSVFKNVAKNEGLKFSELFTKRNFYERIFDPSGAGGKEKACSVTGIEYQLSEMYAFTEDTKGGKIKKASEILNTDEVTLVSESVKDQIIIGEKLVNHRHVIFGNVAEKDSFKGLPDYRFFINQKTEWNYSNVLVLQNFTGADNFPGKLGGNKQAWAFRYFGGATVPLNKDNSPKTFEELASFDHEEPYETNREPSFRRIGVLRMDVDNLGRIFLEGFNEHDKDRNINIAKNASFSAYATLSGFLDLFFSGYINTIREKDDFRNNVTIYYSGGDDLFAVGRWDKIIEFASNIRDEFREFTGRDDITFSGGISMITPKYPVAKAAEDAHRAENIAKNHAVEGFTKNSLCLLDVPVNWDLEWNVVKDTRRKLREWVESKYITKGLLMYLLRLYNSWKHVKELTGNEDYSWKWKAAYNIARRQAKVKDRKSAEYKALEELKQILFTKIGDRQVRFEAFALACRLAELDLRTN
ncbi:MAG: type III-A CRISPR-associated protein Cas10/Csm1 [Bacteroidales bacterium]|nr:type III-A CRISPR-associated protein Cas10/Csm1 [Bacteroidales bacterium]